MVAGLLLGLTQGKGLAQALQMGSAASAASITLPGTTLATRELFDSMLPRIQILSL